MKVIDVIGEQNKTKYAHAPSWEQIEELMAEMKIESIYHFEKFYGIPFNVIAQIKSGKRTLPCKFWHIVYERIKPAYGAGFIAESTTKQLKNRINHCVTPIVTDESTAKGGFHGRISCLNKD